MKNKFWLLFMALVVFMAGMVGGGILLHAQDTADNSASSSKSFPGVIPFSTAGGTIGFFDQNNGKVYLYDGNMQNIVSVAQLDELGKPMSSTQKQKPLYQ